MSVWQRLQTASDKGTGLKLSADDVRELFQHGSIEDEVEEQLHLIEVNEHLDSQPEQPE